MVIPTHVAIIPDGNRRWAKKKGLPFFEGHRTAAEKTLPSLMKKATELGIKYFTFWALSTENFSSRNPKEINDLLNLIRQFLTKKLKEFKKNNIQLRVIGDLTKLPGDIKKGITDAISQTKENSKMTFILAINYGGRNELVRAMKKIQISNFKTQNLDERNLSQFLDTADIPDPDLIIRTGGEKRFSGFMLWQSEYSELYFSNLFFPDFSEKEFEKAVIDYSSRQRKFGK